MAARQFYPNHIAPATSVHGVVLYRNATTGQFARKENMLSKPQREKLSSHTIKNFGTLYPSSLRVPLPPRYKRRNK